MERSNGQPRDWDSRFEAGQLTIIDLSDPFIDPASACGLFEIVTRLFKRADVGTGKVLVVDEAHKVRCNGTEGIPPANTSYQYLSTQTSSSSLTQALLSMIRQMRHLALRVIISTQGTFLLIVLVGVCKSLTCYDRAYCRATGAP
jgi:DNA helicase HerA-like ATPase